jgi:hypothetical protein
MVRISKQQEIRQRCPKRCKAPSPKTGAKKDNLSSGFKTHMNAIDGNAAQISFIPKIK